mmetsp:Transcript_71645/g.231931  ORF Transcript_71645/g.231931 Transcript_71645/m.231931 type:complete len:308 (-) Transcript_71645:77-1000(-)
MAKAQAMLERPWALKEAMLPCTWAERACRKSLCLSESAPKAQAMCESCGAENLSMRWATCAPTSAMSGRFCSPATAKAQVSMATSADLKLRICSVASVAMALISASCEKLFLEKAQAMLASSGGRVPLMLRWISSAMMLKSCWSWMRRFAKAQARCARSCVLNCVIFVAASAEMEDISEVFLSCRLAKDQAVIASGAGAKSLVFLCSTSAMAFMRSSLRVPHCAMAQEMCERLCAVKLEIFLRHSLAMAPTSCSFQRPHFAKAQAVFESCRWSKPSILFTTSAAMTDISSSFRTPREAKPQTMPAMS